MYGMGAASLAESIKGTPQEAQKIIDDFYKGFPKVKSWIDKTYEDARETGYVEDLWGRRRRLPDMQLPKYVVTLDSEKDSITDFNPLLGSKLIFKKEVSPKVKKYEEALKNAKDFRDTNKIKSDAKKEGVTIQDNGGFISRAERQCVNARVQGSAATMSKKAMIKVHSDEVLNKLGFKLLLAVHDELIGECPEENSQQVSERLCELMRISALPECKTPFKCDPTIETFWYEADYAGEVKKTYSEYLSKYSQEKALEKLFEDRCERTPIELKKILGII